MRKVLIGLLAVVQLAVVAREPTPAPADPGDDGPFASAVHVIGRVSAGPKLKLRTEARRIARYDGRKIEALTCLTPSCGSMLLGTDDENLGGWLRRT
ncbi:hypothetical protein OG394_27885 [Kribbella sp. NBC_01245]|uniref:hypothetical protein n=1 Tax=Kribbella sp. NBC_01245 TaxID=2903578 RepID=UPI002E2A4A12|nr:hypothetical protein [Kribbella sp. NBC_01245]